MGTFKIKGLAVSVQSEKAQLATQVVCNFGCSIHFSPVCQWGCTLIGCTFHHTPINCFHGCTFHQPSIYCYQGCTLIGCTFHLTPICPGHTLACAIGTLQCGPTFIDPTRQFDQAELDQMKVKMEELQKEMDAQMAPKTTEDLDMLESKLTEALAEIKDQRSKMDKTKGK